MSKILVPDLRRSSSKLDCELCRDVWLDEDETALLCGRCASHAVNQPPSSAISPWYSETYASSSPNDNSQVSFAIASSALPASPSFLIDERSHRLLDIFYYEGRRANFLRPQLFAQHIQLFYYEPAYRHLLSALITLVNADYEPSSPGTKAYVYASILAAIKRMRVAPDEIDDEAHVQCRSLLALLEQIRVHGGHNFVAIADDVTALFEAWHLEMESSPAHVRQRRRQIMARYSRVIESGRIHWSSILTIQDKPQHGPMSRWRPDFQAAYFEFIAAVQVTSLIAESYGYSICEPINKNSLKDNLKSWYAIYEAATARPELLDLRDLAQARLYLAHYIRCTIVVDACDVKTEKLYARHDVDFGALLDCVERVLMSDFWQNESMWLGVVCPLFFTAVHCRKRVIRQRALELLRVHDISERSWNSRIAYLIASAVAVLESNGPSNTHDRPIVRLLSADFKNGSDSLIITYRSMSTGDKHAEKSFKMLVVGSRDLNACQRLGVWPLIAEVRTHGAAFSRCPLGGPLDNIDADVNDYLKTLKSLLMPRRMELLME